MLFVSGSYQNYQTLEREESVGGRGSALFVMYTLKFNSVKCCGGSF